MFSGERVFALMPDLICTEDAYGRNGGDGMAFIGWLGHYLLVFLALAAVAVLGVFAGKKLSDRR